jgi:hypothetical protein
VNLVKLAAHIAAGFDNGREDALNPPLQAFLF